MSYISVAFEEGSSKRTLFTSFVHCPSRYGVNIWLNDWVRYRAVNKTWAVATRVRRREYICAIGIGLGVEGLSVELMDCVKFKTRLILY